MRVRIEEREGQYYPQRLVFNLIWRYCRKRVSHYAGTDLEIVSFPSQKEAKEFLIKKYTPHSPKKDISRIVEEFEIV